ncbi:hypothetical protein MPK67_gp080 [Erwinia phage pEa_SNUABM_32]|uniref:Uncharacterized protein n=1 Tax=Erwinia phage pEa_SNUABM_32 TaxID=2869555 RepID=A0AAE8C353_9CAUD|nr:hypothetical protein MPK67_gp080 [Erwinia phage pEa_SNUABM_32]QZE56953.1 hypothetical protein pEaSNUABM32_00080 [Erwinia phage pEa_SNUABM_32]
MLVSEKQALYQLLQTAGTTTNSSGWAAFFRNGSSANVPKSLTDLIATSRCAIELKYQNQTADANGILCRLYSRVRSLMPIGGYGQGRMAFDATNKQAVATFAVYPEYSRYIPSPGWSKTPQQVLANLAACSDITTGVAPSYDANDIVEYDYGRTLRFRSFFVPNATPINTGNIRLEYQDPTTLVWTRITVVTGINDVDITARKLRLSMNGTSTNNQLAFTPYAERASDFVTAAFTHVVLVPLTLSIPSGTAQYLSQVQDDYYGLVLDVGTDLVLGVSSIGQYGQMATSDFTVRIVDNILEGV